MTITLDVPSSIGSLIEADTEARRRASAVLIAMFSGSIEQPIESDAIDALRESFAEDATGEPGVLLEDFRTDLMVRWKK